LIAVYPPDLQTTCTDAQPTKPATYVREIGDINNTVDRNLPNLRKISGFNADAENEDHQVA
jgi:hypothetical protein